MRWTVRGVSEDLVGLVREVAAATGMSQGEVLNEVIPELSRRLHDAQEAADADLDRGLAAITEIVAKQADLLHLLQARLVTGTPGAVEGTSA